ncbi:potassium channel subfamily K member 6-like [Macrosteles quadrilineatus]|uniref:potassium channel subfamily K member 6-like n=1 Tax=Macrosteles quadrilineatus TaxID=74068 RepID=UPI0023E2E175|nr:potassium channel subfamily K member 6-like [Macrosteles quadrilineatus]
MDRWKRARLRRVLGLRRSTVLLGCFVLGYIVYLVAGGVVFATLEGPVEFQIRSELDLSISKFKLRYPKVSDDDLESLIEEVVRASNRGVSAARNVSSEPNWSFGQSLFFSSTVVTTIGYGHVTPLSKAGKMFCMLYAMLGIPLTLVLLTALVERLMIPTTLFLQFLNSRLGHLYQPFNIRVLHLFIIATCHIGLMVLIPAAVFASLEPGWDYLDSLYYCFISLTTVGLGDYIPGDSPNQPYRPLYKVATTGYLLIGLTFTMLTLTIFYDIPQLNFGVLFLRRSDEATTDPEKVRLQAPGNLGPKYTQQHDQHIPVKMDTPSPEETTPVHARP